MKESSEEEKEKEENAAVKIQAAFRGHLARAEVKKMKPDAPQEEETEGNKWGDWFYSPAPQKETWTNNPNPSTSLWLLFFFLAREMWCSEITFVAVVKICHEHLFNKHAVEHMPLQDSWDHESYLYFSQVHVQG